MPRRRGSRRNFVDERGDHRSVLAGSKRAIRRSQAPPGGRVGGAAQKRAGSNFLRLERSAARFFEADLVAHSRPRADGSFVQTLTLTDIATGWTDCMPLLFREQTLLTEVLAQMRTQLPMAVLGFDTDNNTVFMNETVNAYCTANAIEFTRSRPYRKNDQAWVEQKNGAIVRRLVGYSRFEGLQATADFGRLYASARLFINYFQPSFKLAEKHRDGARVRKKYHSPATPYQRRLDNPRTPPEVARQVGTIYTTLDPACLLQDIRARQQRLVFNSDMTLRKASSDNVHDLGMASRLATAITSSWFTHRR